MLVFIIVALWIAAVYAKLMCSQCPYTPLPISSPTCPSKCQGDICTLVLSNSLNGTHFAGCLNLKESDKFTEDPVCQRRQDYFWCACTNHDFCNDPRTTPNYTFTYFKILEGYDFINDDLETHIAKSVSSVTVSWTIIFAFVAKTVSLMIL